MILKALKYKSSWLGDWSIVSGTTNDEFVAFENINLIVGRNASGKTRFIDALRWLSDLLEADSRIEVLEDEATCFELSFKDKQEEIHYSVEYGGNESILNEELFINGINKLDRKTGKLFYEKLGQFLDFETNNQFLAIRRRDNIQQPFFEYLHDWGKNLAHFSFGGNMGKGEYKLSDWEHTGNENFKNYNKVNVIFNQGKNEFKSKFEQAIINDMMQIDYFLKSISLDMSRRYIPIKVQESDLPNETYFEQMSQGMARAFSLIVQLNYSLMAKIPSCILIDDIGEGLDYERSKSLIDLIIKKVEGSNIQLFMTTNDRFVMNSVPLKYWSVIHREGNKSVFYNYQNSKQTFDDFALTGFNNFDFFATEFYRLGFEEFIAQ
jgi:AAA15 family ATPase/GTPase